MHSERKPKLGPRAVTVGTLQAFLWTVLSVALSVGSLAAEKAFRKVDVKLPDITADVLDAAILLRHYWYLGLLTACCWPLVNWGVVLLLSPDPETFVLRRLWYLVTWIVPLVAALFALAALMIPLMSLHRQLPGA